MANYKPYALNQLKQQRTPLLCLYFDTETKQTKREGYILHRAKMAWTCVVKYSTDRKVLKERWEYWKDCETMWEKILSYAQSGRDLYVFAHNIFFDLQASGFFAYAHKRGWRHEFNYEKGMVFLLKVRQGKKGIYFLSSTNYYTGSLKSIGESLNLLKKEVDFDKASETQLKDYCHRDVEIVRSAMEALFDFYYHNQLGVFGLTQASLAFVAYRTRFMKTKIFLHKEVKVKELERSAYLGGRVEAFAWRKQSGGPFITLDVNSMYPFIMRERWLPVKLVGWGNTRSIARLKDSLQNHCVIAKVLLKTEQPLYAVKQDGKLIFPTGEFTTYLCTGGLKEALARGHIKKVKRYASYIRGRIFTDYVDFFYGLKRSYKQAGNKSQVLLAKYFLNKLYGKFGQKRMITKEYSDPNVAAYYTKEVYCFLRDTWITQTSMLGKTIEKHGEGEANHASVAIAAHITEYARMYLWSLFEIVGLDKVLYCDTDSLKIRKKDLGPLEYLLDEYRLGYLGIEDESKEFDIRGAKDYRTENKTCLKGVPKNAEQVGEYRYRYMTFFNQATHLRKEESNYYLTREIVKNVTPQYDKGRILPGGRIIPFRLGSDDLPLLPPLEPESWPEH